MPTHLCQAVLCFPFNPAINEVQSSAVGPVDPDSTLTDDSGAANGSRCKPWPFSVQPSPPTTSLGTWATKHLGILHLENDVLYIIT